MVDRQGACGGRPSSELPPHGSSSARWAAQIARRIERAAGLSKNSNCHEPESTLWAPGDAAAPCRWAQFSTHLTFFALPLPLPLPLSSCDCALPLPDRELPFLLFRKSQTSTPWAREGLALHDNLTWCCKCLPWRNLALHQKSMGSPLENGKSLLDHRKSKDLLAREAVDDLRRVETERMNSCTKASLLGSTFPIPDLSMLVLTVFCSQQSCDRTIRCSSQIRPGLAGMDGAFLLESEWQDRSLAGKAIRAGSAMPGRCQGDARRCPRFVRLARLCGQGTRRVLEERALFFLRWKHL